MVGDFERSLRAANKSPKTVEVYGATAHGLIRFVVISGMPTEAGKVRREHVEAYIEDRLARWTPATASQRHRSLQQLFKYLEEEGEIPTHRCLRTKPPARPGAPVPVLPEDELKRLVVTANGKSFTDRRDMPSCGC
jgi:site-specific recombinase XerD